ncbi:hypothetical protein N878_10350 [Pseudomonas sp. EGD-AK9]|nr:hypothetical protein N878_10350 [Pseudomonas sp. EGD-AK9]
MAGSLVLGGMEASLGPQVRLRSRVRRAAEGLAWRVYGVVGDRGAWLPLEEGRA